MRLVGFHDPGNNSLVYVNPEQVVKLLTPPVEVKNARTQIVLTSAIANVREDIESVRRALEGERDPSHPEMA